MNDAPNQDPCEINKFDEIAHRWWDPQSEFKPLHDINPLRLAWLEEHLSLAGSHIVDVGCGGGILAEALANKGAVVTGIDLSKRALDVAQLHLQLSNIKIDYRLQSVESLAQEKPSSFHAVICMEMLEHVPNAESVVSACAKLLKPGGQVFFSTLSRNPKAYLMAIIGAEYILRLLPRGTHDYAKFILPSELHEYCRRNGLMGAGMVGMSYNPLTRHYYMTRDTSVNYFYRAIKPETN